LSLRLLASSDARDGRLIPPDAGDNLDAMNHPVYLTVAAAARLAGCCHHTIKAAIDDGRLSFPLVPTIGEKRLLRREVARFKPRPVGRPPKPNRVKS